MKKVNLLLLTFISIVAFSSCTGNKKTAEAETDQTSATVDQVLAMAAQDVDKAVVVEGLCTHICSHGGKKLFLMGEDDSKTIRVESNDVIGAFKAECANSIVQIKGTLREERIDEAYLVKWEAQLAEGTTEEHGDGEEGCATEQKAQGQDTVTDDAGRIKDFRTKIAARNEAEGVNYLSFYFIEASEYSIL